MLSAQKLVKVNEKLVDILKDGNYPAEFPYKSKVRYLLKLSNVLKVTWYSQILTCSPDLEVS